MLIKFICTHNPQDFFSDLEPHNLLVFAECNSKELPHAISDMVKEGYTLIGMGVENE